MKLQNKINSNIAYLLFGALVLRLVLSFFGTLELDFNTFLAWGNQLAENGFVDFYKSWSDYLPGYLYVLWFLGKVSSLLPVIPKELLFKLPAIISDIAIGYIIYKIAINNNFKEKKALAVSALWLFNPAIFANSSLWGQVDSLTALFSLLSVYLFPVNIFFSAASLAIGALIKPQAAVSVIVIIYLFFRNKTSYKHMFMYTLIGGIVFSVGFLPFLSQGNLFSFIINRLSMTLNQYQYTSVNAFNFWGIFGFWRKDTLVTQSVGYILFFASSIWSAIKLKKSNYSQYLLLAVVLLSNFMFFTRLHERHLLPALAPLAVGLLVSRAFAIPYVILSSVYVLNLYYSYIWINNDFAKVFPSWAVTLFIVIGVVSFMGVLYLVKNLDKKSIKYFRLKINLIKLQTKKQTLKLKEIWSEKRTTSLLLLIVLFSVVTRLVNLNSPPEEYFDEVYHAFTAKQMLNANPKAWEWWNPHPEGFAYEWTHPPLAKEAMWFGMLIVGENALGWRIPAVVAGVLSVILVYLISCKLFENRSVGVLSSAVFALDGLPLVMSRIGMNDIYMLVFVLLSVYLYLEKRHLFAAVAFGLAAASKWSAIWAVPIFLFHHFIFKEKFTKKHLFYFLIPPIVYILSYLPMFTSGHGFDIFVGVQKQMWWYHTRLDATHPFTSPWWSWPVLARPVWVYAGETIRNTISNIYIMGNPVVFWFGLVSVLYSIYLLVNKSIAGKVNKALLLCIFSYFVFFVPWAASPRIMFLYHYLPSIPFLAIVAGFVLVRLPKLRTPVLLVSFIVFMYFLPRFTGIRIPVELDSSYHIFSGW